MCDFLYSKNIFSSHIDLSAFQVYNQNEAVRCTIHNYSNRRSNMNSEMLGISFLQIALGKLTIWSLISTPTIKSLLGMVTLKYTVKLVMFTLNPIFFSKSPFRSKGIVSQT